LVQAFTDLAGGAAQQPAQTVLPLADGASDVIVYPGTLHVPPLAGVKLSPYLAHRPVGQRVTAWTVLLSTDDGRPVLLCDSARLTVERTAATTAVAVDMLAPPAGGTLGVVGAGAIALAHLRHVGQVRPWQRIVVGSPALAEGNAERLAAVQALPFPVEVVGGAGEVAMAADVLCLCTSAAEPVVALADCRADALITSVSTNAPGAHELAAEDITACAVYVDTRTGAPRSASELRRLVEQDRLTIVADLPELVTATAPPRPTGRAFFRSVGLGIEDLAIAALLLRR
jgi:L-arginine dehydrogenase